MLSALPYGRGKCRRARCGRPKIPRCISSTPSVSQLSPSFISERDTPQEPIKMFYDEYEVLRLIDYMGLDQEQAGKMMGVSRGTIWRLLQSARKKLIATIVEGRGLRIIESEPAETET